MAGASAVIANSISNYVTTPVSDMGPVIQLISEKIVTPAGILYVGYSGSSNSDPNHKGLMDGIINIRSSQSSSSYKESEIKTNLDFNNLITD